MSGKSQFPFMIDPNNNDKQMLESDAIISYLWNEYGDGEVRKCHTSQEFRCFDFASLGNT